MPKLVIVSKKSDLQIGRIYRGLGTGPWNDPEPNQYYLVTARSDEKGWIDCLVSFHGEKERKWLEMLASIEGPWCYYEILTD